ncbi:hypothetical protein GJAV_G00138050 [Gymnothorax javanicus]|nr:hypothetical protein GJAV_G00138050 [Gymnothorax javanicus]
MSCSPITGLTCLLCCVMMSAGGISSPQNPVVTIVDFRGEVSWSSGEGNPPGTTYTVEMQLIGEAWSRLENCTDIKFTSCPLIFNLTMKDLMEYYYIRVKASWGGKSSNWTTLRTVQPYGDSLLSAPALNVSVQGRDIYVYIHMPKLVLSVLPRLTYNVQVFESNSGEQEENSFAMHADKFMKNCMKLNGSSYLCESLNLGQRYCVRASAVFTQQQTKPHFSSEKCVDLPDYTSDISKQLQIAIAILTPLLIISALITTCICRLTRPRAADRRLPCSLVVVTGAGGTLVAPQHEVISNLSSVDVLTPSSRSNATLQRSRSSCNGGYECREALLCVDKAPNLPLPSEDEEEPEEQDFLSPSLYSGALHEDERENGIPEGETVNVPPCLETKDWKLELAPTCLDVPMASLWICTDSGGSAESCGESDSVKDEGEETDIEAKLLSHSGRNSPGYLFRTQNELHSPNKFDPSLTYPSGYEPQRCTKSYEPNSSACSHSSVFGGSDSYLKR